MSELIQVEHIRKIFDGKELRIFDDGEPKFLLGDLCKILDLGQVAGVRRRLDDDVIWNHPIIDSLGRTQIALYVDEDGLYDVILDSRKPEAKKFRKWITSEVLPSIRKTGSYQVERPQSIEDLIILQAQSMKDVKERLETIEKNQSNISEVMGLNKSNWRDQMNKIINTIARNNGGTYKQTRRGGKGMINIHLYMAILFGIGAGMLAMAEEPILAVGAAACGVVVGNGSAFLDNLKGDEKDDRSNTR